ncbi:MAG: flagellar hook-basal body complex protein, partial [bacterium]|nr:flagellar hook-basal body complex protein [bacterium]
MMRSLYSAISGLQAHQTLVDVTSHNIANVNTHGYKSERVTFAEQLSQTLFGGSRPTSDIGGINPRQIGLGTRVSSIDTVLTQGSLEQTGNTLDMALSGDGFFVVSDGAKDYYTRAGAFSLDGDGYMTMQGQPYRLRGKMADADGNISGASASDILQLPLSLKLAAKATSEITFASNLDADATTSAATLGGAGTTGINQVSGTAADGSGGVHTIIVTGANATRDMMSSLPVGSLSTRLGDVGGASNVTGVNFSVAVDGGAAQAITGLSVNSTIGDLIN